VIDRLLSNLPLLIAVAVMALVVLGRWLRRNYIERTQEEEHAPRRPHGRGEGDETQD
jgi:hypothetical protein